MSGAPALTLAVLGWSASSVAAAGGWSVQRTPNPVGETSGFLYGVSCPERRFCVAVGHYTIGVGSGTYQRALAEGWNGRRWTTQGTPNRAGLESPELYGVSCWSRTSLRAKSSTLRAAGWLLANEPAWNGLSCFAPLRR